VEPAPAILLVAATELELGGRPGLVCGVGPVEAAATVARTLAVDPPEAVLHVGLAGGVELDPGTLVVGTEAVYLDLSAAIPVVARALPDPTLLAAARRALPSSPALPIGTSASVGGLRGSEPRPLRVEAMEGFAVLRACELVAVPAVEVRAISNAIGERDRGLWELERGLEVLAAAIPRLEAAIRDR
jgi:futalosine hydrolase